MGTGYDQSWNFNEELFANIRMNLAMIKVPESTVIETIDGKEYTFKGAGISEKYKIHYDKTLGTGNAGTNIGDGIHYTFCRIIDKYGYDLFKDTFDYLYELPGSTPVSATNWGKFNFFLDTHSTGSPPEARTFVRPSLKATSI